jgi:hypothetical protein
MPGRPDSSDALFWLVEETIERLHQAIRLGSNELRRDRNGVYRARTGL